MVVGIDLRCLPADGSAGAGVAHAARFLTEALLRQKVPWTWEVYKMPGASGAALRRRMRERPCDVLLVPGGSVAPFLSVPAIPWVHDLAIFDHPEWFPQSPIRRLVTTTLFRRGIQNAPIIFAVSEETKRQIIRHCHIDPNRIVVTHEGGDPQLSVIARNDARERSHSVLFLGTIEPRKNILLLLDAWKMALPSLPKDAELVIAGRDGWRCDGILAQIASTPRIRRVVHVDDDTKRELLLSASLVVVPSLYEGFGLVALEAMQAGVPLIASNAGSLPEVVGDGGMLIDSNDVNAWAEAMRSLLIDEAKRKQLAEKGRVRAKDFSWQKTAEFVVDRLQRVNLR